MSQPIWRWPLIVTLAAAFPALAEPPPSLNAALAAQDSLRRGRELLKKGDPIEAVRVLEERLPFIDGDRAYLAALREDLFARAFAESPAVAKSHAAPWAYCKLYVVHQQLQRAVHDIAAEKLADLEMEISAAMGLAAGDAKLDALGRQLRDEIRSRRGGAAAVEIKFSERGSDGWAKAESPNFRLHHGLDRAQAERIVRAAEAARAAAAVKWTESTLPTWNPPCDVYLHHTAAEYAKATGKPDSSPGHATYQVKGRAVVRRRLDLRADDLHVTTITIPHETTHLVLGDLFAETTLPRWADEAMAVLAEPRDQFERYTRTLHRCRANGELVPLAQLFRQVDYPSAPQITAFYVESVSVVDFLVREGGALTFVQFLRDANRNLEAALQKHYRCRDVAELQDRWLRKTFAASDARGSSQP